MSDIKKPEISEIGLSSMTGEGHFDVATGDTDTPIKKEIKKRTPHESFEYVKQLNGEDIDEDELNELVEIVSQNSSYSYEAIKNWDEKYLTPENVAKLIDRVSQDVEYLYEAVKNWNKKYLSDSILETVLLDIRKKNKTTDDIRRLFEKDRADILIAFLMKRAEENKGFMTVADTTDMSGDISLADSEEAIPDTIAKQATREESNDDMDISNTGEKKKGFLSRFKFWGK